MGSYKGGAPSYWRKGVGQQIARRAAMNGRMKKRVMLSREAVGQVVCYCAMVAADDLLELGKAGVEQLTRNMNKAAEVYETDRSRNGLYAARKKLERESAHLMPEDFVFPAGERNDPTMSMTNWRRLVADRRDAADMTTRLCAKGMERQGIAPDRIRDIMNETRANYVQFLGWAVDGEEVAYEMLRRVVEQMLGETVTVERIGNPDPIFAKEF